MTRKDYEVVAREIRSMCWIEGLEETEGMPVVLVEHIISALSKVFLQDNPRFDEARFRKACGL